MWRKAAQPRAYHGPCDDFSPSEPSNAVSSYIEVEPKPIVHLVTGASNSVSLCIPAQRGACCEASANLSRGRRSDRRCRMVIEGRADALASRRSRLTQCRSALGCGRPQVSGAGKRRRSTSSILLSSRWRPSQQAARCTSFGSPPNRSDHIAAVGRRPQRS